MGEWLETLRNDTSLGLLEHQQASFLAERLCDLAQMPAQNLEGLLLLLLASQRGGSTATRVQDCAQYLKDLHAQVDPAELEELFAKFAQCEQNLVVHRTMNGVGWWGFQRAFLAEQRIAQWLAVRTEGAEVGEVVEPKPVVEFPAEVTPHPLQILAVQMALRTRFCIISGGPGTGKTTVVRAVIENVCRVHNIATDRVVVCAPTGRAKARLAESVGGAISGRTVHSLLAYRENGEPMYHEGRPLPYDLVVVDEVSMVDSAMFAHLIYALDPQARLVLVGDRHQLPSVESGAVLGDLTQSQGSVLKNHFVELTHNYRTSTEIMDWWNGLEQGGVDFRQSEPQVRSQIAGWVQKQKSSWQRIRSLCADAQNPHAVQELKDHVEMGRILTCTNQGPQGREGVNQECWMQWTHSRGKRAYEQAEFADGEPLIVEQNQRVGESMLYNGDLGVVLVEGGVSYGLFYSEGAIRKVVLARVRHLQRAYAITVHKAQGSEFDAVVLLLPGEDSRMVTRQLVYTAITRARRELVVGDSAQWIAKGLPELVRRTWLGVG